MTGEQFSLLLDYLKSEHRITVPMVSARWGLHHSTVYNLRDRDEVKQVYVDALTIILCEAAGQRPRDILDDILTADATTL